MEVAGWILVLLTVFSALLLLCVLAGVILIARNWSRLRPYRRLSSAFPSKAEVESSDADGFDALMKRRGKNSFLPLTFASRVQSESDGQVVLPSVYEHSGRSSPAEEYRMRPMPYRTNSVLSIDRDRQRALERRLTDQDVKLARWCSLDDVASRSYIHTRSVNDLSLSLAQPMSPLTAFSDTPYFVRGRSVLSPRGRPSLRRARGDEKRRSTWDRAKEIESSYEDVYLHGLFLPDIQDIASHDPVISYDQTASREEDGSYPGALKFSLHYEASELRITVRQALDLPSRTKDPDGTVNCYINLCLVPEDFLWKRTRLVENSRSPVFDQSFLIPDVLYHKLREYTLCFFVMDVDGQSGERVVGKVWHPLSDLRMGPEVDICVELTPQ